jgi:hypothetical protein
MFSMLLKFCTAAALGVTLAVVLPPAPTLAAADHVVPFNTPVYVRLAAPLRSDEAYSGMPVQIVVVQDVVVDGYVVIERGAHGMAQVVDGQTAGPGSVGGLTVALQWVRAVDHTRIGILGGADAAGDFGKYSGVGNTLFVTGAVMQSYGAYQAGAVTALGGIVAQGITASSKGGEAVLSAGDVMQGAVANAMGVDIPSDIPADPEDGPGVDTTPVR